MGTWHSSGRKWLLPERKGKKHSLNLLVTHTSCLFCQRPQWHSATQFLNTNQTSVSWTEIHPETPLGAMPTISLGAGFSQETPHEPVQRKWSVRQFTWTNLLLERQQLCAPKIWVTVSHRDTIGSTVPQWTNRKALCVLYTDSVLDFSQLRKTRKLRV